ncbi:RHS repeat-associated core domain-containing protein [Kaistella flava (ex Peng et al. 2021)]|uniref:RHS repeat-associated core domain-containing protein n=2 Tax=Kaistella flava (ex Peng et al. 2021) TaxID=2038776 RepID=A0A7M2YE59_9FLAO|nr:RHS repeat-associated core domain-containing protein [Kaistella flava (ex Peng et al. 2021)]
MSSLNGGIQSDVEALAVTSYNNDPNPFSHKVLENSPLDRINAQINPGAAWANKPINFTYEANATNDVIKFNTSTNWIDGRTNSVLTDTGFYTEATLYKNTVEDEDHNKTIEFKNGEGQTLLVRKSDGNNPKIDTYYVYNEYNQLAFVISPLAVGIITLPNTLNDLCYQYRYDGKGRLVEKKLPGKDWEYMVYDKADRLILTQDALLRADSKWLFTKYDQFGRVIYTGMLDDGGTRFSRQDAIKDLIIIETRDNNTNGGFVQNGITVQYTKGYYTNISTLLSVNYYDLYPTGTPFPSGDQIFGVDILKDTSLPGVNQSTQSLPTASMVKNIENNGWTKNYTFYDIKARPIGTYSFNYLGGYTKTESNLDFAGIPQKTYTYHKRKSADNELQIKERFVYNQYNNALEKHFHNVNNQAEDELLVENTYNEIGQLTNKKVGGTAVPLTGVGISAPIQSVDYSYNIRGWMTGINLDTAGNFKPSKLFNYKINYNEPLSNFTKKPYVADQSLEVKEKFNGNISAVTWKSSVDPAATEKKYGYVYDPLNRLLAGFYYEKSGADFIFTEEYNELLDYDPNGNISHLKRFSFKQSTAANMIDDLNYTYENNNQSNRLQKIDDPSTNTNGYEGGGLSNSYDLNGNMTQMPDKGIITPIAYNFLNLPSTIKQGRNTTNYLYRADGTKLKKTFNFVNKMGSSLVYTEYLDGFQYSTPNTDPLRMALEEQDDETVSVAKAANIETFSPLEDRAKIVAPPENAEPPMILSFFPTAEGFYDYENFRYIYQYKDHLGNVRVSYVKDGSSLKVMDTNDYYPFGMSFIKSTEIAVYDPLSVPYNYKYNGKELQETGMYDYGARFYMPDIGRWGVVDPLAEKYFNISPFNYTANNPILYIDPDGMQLDLSDIMKKGNEEQYKAFVFFAKTKEGQTFLSKYMEKGQKVEYGGKTIFEAKANGEFHDKGIDLSYGVRTDDNVGSETGGKMKGDRANVDILISRKAFGDSGSQFFNTLEHIVHESFLHADLNALDLDDDGYKNSSSIPKAYRQYDTWSSQNGQHYYMQAEYLKDPTNNKVNTYTKEGFNILKQANQALKLKLGDSQIKQNMWNFNGSYINVAKDGKLIHRDTEKK